MPNYAAPAKGILSFLFDVMNISASPIPGYSDTDPPLVSALGHEVLKISTDILLPLNASGDAEAHQLNAGTVHTPSGFVSAFIAMREDGLE